MTHADLSFRFGPNFDPLTAACANKVGDANPLSFHVFPNLRVQATPLQFNERVAVIAQVSFNSPRSNRAHRDFVEETAVGFEGRHAGNNWSRLLDW